MVRPTLTLFIFICLIVVSKGEHQDDELLKELKLEVSWMKNRMMALETQVNEQGRVIKKLEVELVKRNRDAPQRQKRSTDDQQIGPPLTRRSCAELFQAEPSLPSGNYWIDPDGQGTGDEPIQVYCNMTTGATLVSHDSESTMTVRPCDAKGDCYKREVTYKTATLKQLEILTKLSSECSQAIRYECQNAPLKSSEEDQSFWRDRHGNRNYDWTGAYQTHYNAMCQCGLTQTCRDRQSRCNCNSEPLRTKSVDHNVITDKNRLPVTRLNFGLNPTSKNAQANYTLGPLKCSGLGGFRPSSCLDLWRAGHTLNGFYPVQPSSGKRFAPTETIFCDFKLLREVGLLPPATVDPYQIADLKNQLEREVNKTRIFFDVYKTRATNYRGPPQSVDENGNSTGPTVTYDGVNVNVGGAINPKTGIFIAPQDGVYMLSFTAQYVHFANGFVDARFIMQRNGVSVTANYASGEGVSVPISMFTIQQLSRGDEMAVIIHAGGSWDTKGEIFTHFSGVLLS